MPVAAHFMTRLFGDSLDVSETCPQTAWKTTRENLYLVPLFKFAVSSSRQVIPELTVIIFIAWYLLEWENKHINAKQFLVEQSTSHDLFPFGSTLEPSICSAQIAKLWCSIDWYNQADFVALSNISGTDELYWIFSSVQKITESLNECKVAHVFPIRW